MDIFGNEFDIHINANGTEYTGQVIFDNEGTFDTGLELQNGIGTFGHFSGDILRNGDNPGNHYTAHYLFEQCIIHPELPVLHSFTGEAELHVEGNHITFGDENITVSLHSLKKPVENEKPADNDEVTQNQ
ncbi:MULTISPECIES: hypothetical protein [Ehrlichia]|uniref:Uncharacterized protein n=1 Tax=Ehrlichia cf. muris str. EmCRT TaxID=1359167 RepID=A0A0F3N5X1_9RICK|nr:MULTISPECIES: hypothetical protein [Ehrlichia]KJV63498.1 hypothetical protein EMUCRT_0953 [Ehrlichia cf. muris str. EmCRT]OUC04199.1 hypothetical protein DB91_03940 [Ehrlichia sp. Wisconsin_h]